MYPLFHAVAELVLPTTRNLHAINAQYRANLGLWE
jgi:hypothetical protein